MSLTPEAIRRIDRRIEAVDKRSERRDAELGTRIGELGTELAKLKNIVSRWQLVAVFIAGASGASAPELLKQLFGF